jgi:uncharacterized protein YecE (DUF72 family)
MKKFELSLPYRGARDYLQGADLVENLLSVCGAEMPDGPLLVQFHTLLKVQPDLLVDVEDMAEARKLPGFCAEARFGTAAEPRYAVWLASERAVTERKVCNEAEVAAAAVVDVAGRSAVLPFPSPGTPMEMIVFLNKQLHFQVLPQVKAKWLFVKLELKQRLPEKGERELKLVLRQVLGERFTKAEILIDGVSYGAMIFSTQS